MIMNTLPLGQSGECWAQPHRTHLSPSTPLPHPAAPGKANDGTTRCAVTVHNIPFTVWVRNGSQVHPRLPDPTRHAPLSPTPHSIRERVPTPPLRPLWCFHHHFLKTTRVSPRASHSISAFLRPYLFSRPSRLWSTPSPLSSRRTRRRSSSGCGCRRWRNSRWSPTPSSPRAGSRGQRDPTGREGGRARICGEGPESRGDHSFRVQPQTNG